MSERNTHFQRFAELLFNDLSQLGLTAIVDPRNFRDHLQVMVEVQEQINRLTKQVIAQRAYDLMANGCLAISNEQIKQGVRLHPDAMLRFIPDLTEWPEKRSR